ncbi:hypothetical protein [Azospirillum brasilense]|uniref:hypothetical protein n=1 Tax=Azospirillum brasilense TaxID=192 RepID=UPI000E0A4F59|nr:hypothetical protein [Azospirillum brasilense]
MTASVVYAEVVAKGCTVELYLNRIPLGRIDPERMPHLEIAVSEFLLDGVNELAMIVEPGPTPSTALANPMPAPTDGKLAAARLARYRPDEFVGGEGGVTLVELGWEPKTPEPQPRLLTRRADLGPQFGRWGWQDAPVLTLDRQLASETGDLLRRLHQAMAAGDGRGVTMLLSPAYYDLSRAYPRPPNAWAEGFETFMARVSRQPEWRMQPLDPARVDFRLVAGGHMLECIDKDWQPTLRTEPLADGMPFTLPVFLARLNGRLAVVR